jgi:hypothetical protein
MNWSGKTGRQLGFAFTTVALLGGMGVALSLPTLAQTAHAQQVAPTPLPSAPNNVPPNQSFAPAGSVSVTVNAATPSARPTYPENYPPPEQPPADYGEGDNNDPNNVPASAYEPPVVEQAPPAPMQEAVPVAPAPNYVWAPGYWYWYGADYSWVPGRWLAPQPGYYYVGARWGYRGGRWAFAPGGWSLAMGGPVVYPTLFHTWGGWPGGYRGRHYYAPAYRSYRYGGPRAYVAPPVRGRYYAPAPRGRYYAPPVRSHYYAAPPARRFSAPPGRSFSAPPARHYSAPPSRGRVQVNVHHR